MVKCSCTKNTTTKAVSYTHLDVYKRQLIKELIDKKAYLGIFAALRKQQAQTFTTAAMLQELHLIPWLRQDLLQMCIRDRSYSLLMRSLILGRASRLDAFSVYPVRMQMCIRDRF